MLSQAGTIRGRGRAASGSRAMGPRGSYLGGYSAGRGIYSRYHEGKAKQQDKPYELVPSLELAAVNPVGLKPGTSQCESNHKFPPFGTWFPLFHCCTPLGRCLQGARLHGSPFFSKFLTLSILLSLPLLLGTNTTQEGFLISSSLKSQSIQELL